MTFLAMIVALILLQVLGANHALQQDDWFRSLQRTCRGMGFSPTVGFVFYVGVPLIVLSLLLGSLENFLFGIPNQGVNIHTDGIVIAHIAHIV